MKRYFRFLTLSFGIAILLACGGGSLDSDTDQPTALVLVNAGPNQSVNEGATAALNGEASGQTDAITYAWSSVPNIVITQVDSSSAAATFVAPTTTEQLSYTFTLVATDGNGNQASDSVDVIVQPVNELPSAVVNVTLPTSVTDQNYPAGINVILDGSASVDIDSGANIDPIASYRWQQTAGQDVLGSISLDGDSIAFVTPILDENSTLSFSLTVMDQEGGEDSTEFSLSILGARNTLPTVNAGLDHQVFSGESILLTGEAATTIPAARPLQFTWLNDSEFTPTIDNNTSLRTFAVAPKVESEQLITFTIEVTDTFGNVVEDSLSVRIKPLPINPINDTGIGFQATATTIGSVHQADYPGQDGQRGHDVIHSNGLLEKAGRGDQGFDFTRLDSIGDEQDDITQPWSCVRDNVTGLVWEVKTDDTMLHGSVHTYSWFLTEQNGGLPGDVSGAGTSCTIAQCNTLDFIAAVNAQGLCNFFDWRLPTHNELLSVLHLGKNSSPLIDDEYFPNTNEGIAAPLFYWTSQPSVDGVSNDAAQNAWTIDYATGNDNFLNKSTPARVRLVRGGR